MSFFVVAAVAVVVFFWVKATRQARRDWLKKVELPGRWLAEDGDADYRAELSLQGGLDAGEFLLQRDGQSWRGQWRLQGHTLTLSGEGREQTLDLHFFSPGSIGLEDEQGKRRLYNKLADNVVQLRGGAGPSQKFKD